MTQAYVTLYGKEFWTQPTTVPFECEIEFLFAFVAEQTAHRRAARLCRMLVRELDLDTVMTGFTERIHLALLFTCIQHCVELLMGGIPWEFFCLFRAGNCDENNRNQGDYTDKNPVPFTDFQN